VTVAAVFIPLQLVFGSEVVVKGAISDWWFTLLFSADIVVGRVTKGWKQGVSRQSEYRPAERGEALWIVVDVLAAIPFQTLFATPLVGLFRLLKLCRVALHISYWHRHHPQSWPILRLGFFLYWMLLSVHWLSCGWLALHGRVEEVGAGSAYIRALYWCVQTLTTVGYGDVVPSNTEEMLYAMAVMMVGVGTYGYVIGAVVAALSNINPAKAEYLAAVERIDTFMRYKKIPADLQHRIREYYAYLWEKRLGLQESRVVSELPPGLMEEVSLFLKRGIIEKVPFFKGASDELVREISTQMRPVVYTPGDYVFRAGDTARDMFFISSGSLEVVSRDGATVYTTLSDGDFFGEIALLLKRPRTASVRALEHCELYRLDKESFDRVVAGHADFAAHIAAMTKERQERGM
jgi:voltage-gated potassium channel